MTPIVRCSFCRLGNDDDSVLVMVAGPDGEGICDRCAVIVSNTIREFCHARMAGLLTADEAKKTAPEGAAEVTPPGGGGQR